MCLITKIDKFFSKSINYGALLPEIKKAEGDVDFTKKGYAFLAMKVAEETEQTLQGKP